MKYRDFYKENDKRPYINVEGNNNIVTIIANVKKLRLLVWSFISFLIFLILTNFIFS